MVEDGAMLHLMIENTTTVSQFGWPLDQIDRTIIHECRASTVVVVNKYAFGHRGSISATGFTIGNVHAPPRSIAFPLFLLCGKI